MGKKGKNRFVLFVALFLFCVSFISITACRQSIVRQHEVIRGSEGGETGGIPSGPDAFAGDRRYRGAESAPAAASAEAPLSPAAVDHESPWITQTSIYEGFVDRFGENLQGVTDRLDYLEKLGVKTIWLMPIFRAMSDHAYNTIDYCAIESRYGTANDLKELAAAAHAKGMRVILDLEMNH